jgi:hypothetical protein
LHESSAHGEDCISKLKCAVSFKVQECPRLAPRPTEDKNLATSSSNLGAITDSGANVAREPRNAGKLGGIQSQGGTQAE